MSEHKDVMVFPKDYFFLHYVFPFFADDKNDACQEILVFSNENDLKSLHHIVLQLRYGIGEQEKGIEKWST